MSDKIEEKLRSNPALLVELQAYLKKATADDAAAAAQSARLDADIKAGQRRHHAFRLVRDLREAFHFVDDLKLRPVVESALAELPDEKLDDAALTRLRARHASLHLVKQIAALKGPMSAANEIALFEAFQKALSPPIPVQRGKAR